MLQAVEVRGHYGVSSVGFKSVFADVEKENDSFINNQSQQATQIMNEQGELIVNLNNAVGRLIPLTQEIKQELDVSCRFCWWWTVPS